MSICAFVVLENPPDTSSAFVRLHLLQLHNLRFQLLRLCHFVPKSGMNHKHILSPHLSSLFLMLYSVCALSCCQVNTRYNITPDNVTCVGLSVPALVGEEHTTRAARLVLRTPKG